MADTTLAFVFQARNAEQVAAQSELIRQALDKVGEQAKRTDKEVDGIGKQAGGMLRLAGGFAAGQLAVLGFTNAIQTGRRAVESMIKGALEAEDATARLGFALQQTGQYSAAAVSDLQAWAEGVGAVSGMSDEAVQNVAALIAQISGLRGQQLKDTAQAALDLSAALGIGAEAAARLLGKAALGETSMLGRYAILVDEGASATVKFGQALDQVKAKFGGTAAALGATSAGAFRAFKEEIGNVAEALGGPIVQRMAGALRTASQGIRELRQGMTTIPGEADPLVSWIRDLEAFSVYSKRAGDDIEEFRRRAATLKEKIVAEFELRIRQGNIEEAVALFRTIEEQAKKSAASGAEVWEDMLRGIREAAGEGFSMRINLDVNQARADLLNFLREMRTSKEDVTLLVADEGVAQAVAHLRGIKTEQESINEELRAFQGQLQAILEIRRKIASETRNPMKAAILQADETALVEQAENARRALESKGVKVPISLDFRSLKPEDVQKLLEAAFVDVKLAKQAEIAVLMKIDASKTEADIAAALTPLQDKIRALDEEFSRTGSRSAQALGQAYSDAYDKAKAAALAKEVKLQVLGDFKGLEKGIEIVTKKPVEVPIVFGVAQAAAQAAAILEKEGKIDPVQIPTILKPPDLVQFREGINLGKEQIDEDMQRMSESLEQGFVGGIGNLFGAMIDVTGKASDRMVSIVAGMVNGILRELARLAAHSLWKLLLKLAGIVVGTIVGGPAGTAIATATGIAAGGAPGGGSGSSPHPGPKKPTVPVPEPTVPAPAPIVIRPEVQLARLSPILVAPDLRLSRLSPLQVSPEIRAEPVVSGGMSQFLGLISSAAGSLARLQQATRPEIIPTQGEAERLLSAQAVQIPSIVQIQALDAQSFETWIRSGDGGRVLQTLAASGRIGG